MKKSIKTSISNIKLTVISLTALLLFACAPDNTPKDTTIDISAVMKANHILSKTVAERLLASADFKQADIAIITYLNTIDYQNSTVYKMPPNLSINALFITKYMEKMRDVSCNGDRLMETSPLLFPGYFFAESKNFKDNTKHNYSLDSKWAFNYQGKDITLDSKYQSSIYPLYIDGIGDSLMPGKEILVRWEKTQNKDSADNKVMIYFKWFPSHLESQATKIYKGYDAEDTGILAMTYDKLKELGVPLYGVFQINVVRYKIRTISESPYKIIMADVAETSVSTYIKK